MYLSSFLSIYLSVLHITRFTNLVMSLSRPADYFQQVLFSTAKSRLLHHWNMGLSVMFNLLAAACLSYLALSQKIVQNPLYLIHLNFHFHSSITNLMIILPLYFFLWVTRNQFNYTPLRDTITAVLKSRIVTITHKLRI